MLPGQMRSFGCLWLLLLSFAVASRFNIALPAEFFGETPDIEKLYRYLIPLEETVKAELATARDEIDSIRVEVFAPLVELLPKFEHTKEALMMMFESHFRIFNRSLTSLPALLQAIGRMNFDWHFGIHFDALRRIFDEREYKCLEAERLAANDAPLTSYYTGYSKEEIGHMMKIISDFEKNVDHYTEMINNMFPSFDNFDDAMEYAVKHYVLYQRLIYRVRDDFALLPSSYFSLPLHRCMAYDKIQTTVHNLAMSNSVCRMISKAKESNDPKTITDIFQLFNCFAGTEREALRLPPGPDQELFERVVNKLNLPQRGFLLVMLLQYASKVILKPENTPKSWEIASPLSVMFTYQMMVAIKPFVAQIETSDGTVQLMRLFTKFREEVTLSCPNFAAKIETYRKFVMSSIPRREATILAKPEYEIFRPVDTERLFKLISSRPEPQAPSGEAAVFFDSDVSEKQVTIDDKEAREREKRAKRNQARRAQKKKKKQEAKAASAISIEAAESEREEEQLEKVVEKQKDIVKVDKKKEEAEAIAEFAKGKEEEKVETPVGAELQEDIDELLREHRETYERYNRLKRLPARPMFLERDCKVVKEAKLPSAKLRVIASFTTEDWRQIHKEANQVFVENQMDTSARLVYSKSRNLQFQWVFNPQIIIKADTYKFLCQLFGLTRGMKKLTYGKFINAFMALNPSKRALVEKAVYQKKSKRTVFQFEHAIEINGTVFVPPIGGIHREHESSGFNHERIRDFMMHAGAHPYFFIVLQ